jgi:tetratricopeptide (TPR) repeat protein
MKIKSMKKVKAISALLVTFTALLPFQEANAQRGSSYVLPPFAPSNTVVQPFYYPRVKTPNVPGENMQRRNTLVKNLFEEASDARWAGNYTTEFKLYNKIISLDSQEAQAYFNRGSIKQKYLNDRAGAIADFRAAFKLFRQQGDKYMTEASMEHLQQLSER